MPKLRLCVDVVVLLDGSEDEFAMNPSTEDEMVEAVKGRDGAELEEVKARVMLMSDGVLSGVSTRSWLRV